LEFYPPLQCFFTSALILSFLGLPLSLRWLCKLLRDYAIVYKTHLRTNFLEVLLRNTSKKFVRVSTILDRQVRSLGLKLQTRIHELGARLPWQQIFPILPSLMQILVGLAIA
jgi:hypothetical protein